MDLEEQIRIIKKHFRGAMQRPISDSLRSKGLNYRVIFGVDSPRLFEMSKEFPHSHEIAQALWKEDIRECRLIAPMLQPHSSFYEDIAEIWIESMKYPEEAEVVVMYLLQHLDYASMAAFKWIADKREFFQICGFLLLARLLMQGKTFSERDEEEFLDQVMTAIQDSSVLVKNAAIKALRKYMEIGEEQTKKANDFLSKL